MFFIFNFYVLENKNLYFFFEWLFLLGDKYSNAVRFLGVDQIRQAKSGHTGIVLGFADVLTELFKNHIIFNPHDAKWLGRDRFILSAGHGSAMLYAMLYLTGYDDISINDLRNFRQINSKTAGHPEYNLLDGVEITTGPLGFGISSAVGMALGQKMLEARFGKLFNSKTYCFVSDGDLMEGISYEACSFAGHHKLNNLIVIHDDNKITIDGSTDITTSEDMLARFKACGFEVMDCDGHNVEEINKCFELAKKSEKPVFIQSHTHIGYGCLKQDSNKIHGSVLSDEEYEDLKQKMEWKNDPFEVDEDILNDWWNFWKRNEDYYNNWQKEFANSDKKDEIKKFFDGELSISKQKQEEILAYFKKTESEATRKSSGVVLEAILAENPQIIGGTADLGSSIMSYNSVCKPITKDDKSGNYIHYGIREFAMGGIMCGLATCGFVPYSGTFLVFSDTYKLAIRMSALMKLPMIHILTHDSFYVGEDGTTHQPIEQLDALRATPEMLVFRPCDIDETLECYNLAIKTKKPFCMVLSRQNLPQIHNKKGKIENGAYTIYETENCDTSEIDYTFLTSGSEVELCIKSAKKLEENGKKVRVLSFYCIELFNKLSKEQQNLILYGNRDGNITKKHLFISVEASTGLYLGNLVNNCSCLKVHLDFFGKSGKPNDLAKAFGFTAEQIVEKIGKFSN